MGQAKNSSLTIGERKQLVEHETRIRKGIESFVEMGESLAYIRDNDLFTDVDPTFEGYCKKRWSFSSSRARQIIDASRAAKVIESVTNGNTIPANERVARELAAIPDETKQADAWVKATETAPKDANGQPKITAAHVKKTIQELEHGQPELNTAITKKPEPAKPNPDPVRPFAELPSLPNDVCDAFENFKLCVLRHRLAGWNEISREDMVLSLQSLIAFAEQVNE